MNAIINGKTFEVKNEKEARKLANGKTFTLVDGIVYRIIHTERDVEALIQENRRAKDNLK